MGITGFAFIMAAILAGTFSEIFSGCFISWLTYPPAHRLSG
jgi:hypothetical protein